MSFCVAPIARRTPISLMRSRIDASMMFMIPMPPTISEIDAIAPSTMLKIVLVRCSCLQQQLRHGDLEVDDRVVPARRASADHVGDRRHLKRESSTRTMILSSWLRLSPLGARFLVFLAPASLGLTSLGRATPARCRAASPWRGCG